MEEVIKITLISAGAVLGGALIGVFGQLLANWISYGNQIRYVQRKIYFQKKLEYAEKTLEIIDLRVRKFVDFYNLLKKIPFKDRTNINSAFSIQYLNGESPLFQNKSNLYFTKFLFPKEIMVYLDLEKEFQDKIKKLENNNNEDHFKKGISEIGYLLQDKILAQTQSISTSFKKELER